MRLIGAVADRAVWSLVVVGVEPVAGRARGVGGSGRRARRPTINNDRHDRSVHAASAAPDQPDQHLMGGARSPLPSREGVVVGPLQPSQFRVTVMSSVQLVPPPFSLDSSRKYAAPVGAVVWKLISVQ